MGDPCTEPWLKGERVAQGTRGAQTPRRITFYPVSYLHLFTLAATATSASGGRKLRVPTWDGVTDKWEVGDRKPSQAQGITSTRKLYMHLTTFVTQELGTIHAVQMSALNANSRRKLGIGLGASPCAHPTHYYRQAAALPVHA